MSAYDKTIGRLRLVLSGDGARMPDYRHGVSISCPNGWNAACEVQTHTISVEELRDLRHLIDRALAVADGPNPRHP